MTNEEIYNQYLPVIEANSRACAKDLGMSPSDFLQDVLLHIFEQREKISAARNPAGYIARLIYNFGKDELRRRAVHCHDYSPMRVYVSSHKELQDLADGHLDPYHDPADTVMEEELFLGLMDICGELGERQREVFERVWLDGQKYSDVADALGITKNTVGATAHQVRKKIMEGLDDRDLT